MVAIAPQQNQAIVDRVGFMTSRFRAWTQQLTRAVPLRGTGSPEGVVEAAEDRLYVDSAGAAGNILYVKRDADIGGDRSQGWILV